MRYRENAKNGEKISQLGLGCMRLPRKAGRIDQEKTNELVSAAIDGGVNYFDTAYIYPGSEEALGKALANDGRRADINIATKLPHSMCAKPEDFDKFFKTHLERLRTEIIDYYLIHMLSSVESWERLKTLGIEQWLAKKREQGEVRNVGFSFHGGRAAFLEILEVYDWDFCLVQYNYFDENNQAGKLGVKTANEKGLSVFVMEPLRGGLLVNGLTEDAKQKFSDVNPERSLADWALRWLYNQPEVTMTLSGMSAIEQLAENLVTADDAEPDSLVAEELAAYGDVVSSLSGTVRVPCTACNYCMPCPKGVDIPACFSSYNSSYAFGLLSGIKQYVQVTGLSTSTHKDASKCVACGSCEKHCTQGIKISAELVRVKRRMKSFAVRPAMSIGRGILGMK